MAPQMISQSFGSGICGTSISKMVLDIMWLHTTACRHVDILEHVRDVRS